MKYKNWQSVFILALMLSASALTSIVGAQGFIVPFSGSTLTPSLIQQNTTITLQGNHADVLIRQTFQNPHDLTIEGFYLHPLPTEAEAGSVVLEIKGRGFRGQVLDQATANDIYVERFRKTGNRAFLTMIQNRLYKVRAYPFFAGQKLELRLAYSMKLTHDPSGQRKLTYPLYSPGVPQQNAALDANPRYRFASSRISTAGHFGSTTATSGNFQKSLTIEISDQAEVGGIYSTTHAIKIDRIDKHSARIRADVTNPVLDKEFVLYTGTREKDIDINILSRAAQGGVDGYFVATISPDWTVSERQAVPKDVVFILDLSNAMQAQRLNRSKDALEYCIANLNKTDRFNIITFATDVRLFQKRLVPVGEYRADGLAFLRDLRPRGGANMHSAILTALSLKGEPGRESRTIILLTAGAHTVGVTDPSQIANDIEALNVGGYRIYAFNVGSGASDQLLSRVSQISGGDEHHVPATADIVSVVAKFYDSIDLPVMSAPRITFSGLEIYDVYPARLPSVVAGRQQHVAGRFKGSGRLTAILSGLALAGQQDFTCETEVGGESSGNDTALPAIWARMKMASLLDDPPRSDQKASRSTQSGSFIQRGEKKRPNGSAASELALQRIRHVNDRVFRRTPQGGWLEGGLSVEASQARDTRHIIYRSQEYYDYVQGNPAAAQYLAIGPNVLFQFDNTLIKIDEQISPEGRIITSDN